jgi:hypothetical protein
MGYAPGLAVTGLYALDGARYLRGTQHADTMLGRLVAHHSWAIIEARERGLADVLSVEFEPAPHALSSVLTYCDMTTKPGRRTRTAGRRLAEIHHRYGPGHLVSRSIQRATPMILRAVQEVQDRGFPKRMAPQMEQGRCLHDLDLGWNRVQLAPGMAPRARSRSSNYSSELEPRYGIEP